jgi:hypothetical protein
VAIEYREWREGDDLALLEIWGDPETVQAGQFRGTLAPSGNAPWRRCIVAEDVVDGVAIPVAEAAGLAPIQRSRLVKVEPAALRLPVFGDGSEAAASEQVEDLATGSVELSDVVGRYYTAVHGWDSPGELSIATVQRLFLDDLSGAHGAIVLRAAKASAFGQGVPASRKGRLEAFAISYAQGSSAGENAGGENAATGTPDQPSDVFLGHEPKLSADQAQAAVRDLLALIAYQYPVLLEVDDSMTALRAVVEPLLEGGKARVQGAETLVVSD